jgi:formate-nitrite transporter family protein
LSRGFWALWWSGVAAGLAISMSVICKVFLPSILPPAEWAAGIFAELTYAQVRQEI